jgi:hypothetical protein
MGATSTRITTFSADNWDLESFEALSSVKSYASQRGFVLIQTDPKQYAVRAHDRKGVGHNKGIYVLQLDNRPTPFFYVGKATNIALRIQQHQDGTGAFCITGKPFTRVDPVTKGSTDDMESWERNEVLTRMFEFGIDNVRGWMYTLKTMPEEQKISAFDQVCEKFDRCRKCGRGTHFVRDCQALSADLWTNGMELRTMYPQGAGAQTLLQLADAERRIAEAAKALMGRQ